MAGPAEQRERIFQPFYRGPGASSHAPGSGVGLALVGEGSCFTVRLPLSRESAVQTGSDGHRRPRPERPPAPSHDPVPARARSAYAARRPPVH